MSRNLSKIMQQENEIMCTLLMHWTWSI